MIKNKKLSAIITTGLIISMCFTACGENLKPADSQGINESQSSTDQSTKEPTSTAAVNFTSDEVDDSYDEATATKIVFSTDSVSVSGSGASASGAVATINSGGTFVVTGNTENGQIIVNSAAKDRVQMVLKNATINCNNSAPIFIQAAEKTVVTLANGTVNTLTDTGEYTLDADGEPTATLFSKDDLVINGTGSLNVTAGYLDGIVSKDDLKLVSGTISVTSVDDGILGKDLLAIKNADITINSVGKGLKATNDTDSAKGLIYIEAGSFDIKSTDDAINSCNLLQIDGGSFKISTEDDGLHADKALTINGGNIEITDSNEGIESADITINEGNINVTSTDDGINASASTTSEADTAAKPDTGGTEALPQEERRGKMGMQAGDNKLTINGGYIVVNAQGDGVDINGSGYVTAGTLIVTGPDNSGNGALDYDGEFVVSGGTVLAVGAAGMAQATSDTSTIPTVSINLDARQSANTIFRIEDSDGNSVITFSPKKSYQSIVFACDTLKEGKSYSIYIGGNATSIDKDGLCDDKGYTKGEIAQSFTISGTVTSVGTQSGMGGFGGTRGGANRTNSGTEPPQMPNGQAPSGHTPPNDGTMPEGVLPQSSSTV